MEPRGPERPEPTDHVAVTCATLIALLTECDPSRNSTLDNPAFDPGLRAALFKMHILKCDTAIATLKRYVYGSIDVVEQTVGLRGRLASAHSEEARQEVWELMRTKVDIEGPVQLWISSLNYPRDKRMTESAREFARAYRDAKVAELKAKIESGSPIHRSKYSS